MPHSEASSIQEKVLLTWTAPSRLFRPKNRQFYTTALVILILVGIIFVIAGELMLIATLASLVFAYYLWSTIPPEEVSYSLTTRGLRTPGQLVLWDYMDRWWTEDRSGHTVLLIDTPRLFPPRYHLILTSYHAKDIIAVMTHHILMERPEPTSLDKAGRWLSAKFPLEKEA